MMMKRSFHEAELDSITMANCLMLLSKGKETTMFPSFQAMIGTSINNSPSRVFMCKTCNRQFSSFQALGGHRASHKKPRLIGGEGSSESQSSSSLSSSSQVKPKTHECSVCGLEFAIGQALGGHMRRHRAALSSNNNTDQIQSSSAHDHQMVSSPIVKKSNSRRVLRLDLNLTPYENDLEFFRPVGKAAPMVDCSL